MIFRRTLTTELTNAAGGVFVALFTIFLTMTLIKMLGQAANGRIASEAVFALIAFASLNALPLLLPPTFFIAVLLVLTRWYRDHEMVIWLSSGLSLKGFVRPVLRVALPLALIVALCAFVISPWANRQTTEMKQRFERRSDTSRVAPGEFSESGGAQRVFFIESISENGRDVHNVFISQQRPAEHGMEQSVLFANSGKVGEVVNGENFLVLENGRRYDGNPGLGPFDVVMFERYGVLLDAKPDLSPISFTTNAVSTGQLLRALNKPDGAPARAEVARRIGWPLMVLTLALLAIPLSYAALRAGRSMNVLLALLLFAIYNNLSYLVQARVFQERLSFGVGWWLTHGCVLLTALWLMFWRENGRHRVGMVLGRWRARVVARRAMNALRDV
ncbi:MAG: LPS export ABC transporter permease LptF [Burkholderiaceae bacterium]|nr:MAG: LPS export ABC transporter permease LptF [Burkholderiaceae bacterium]